MLTVTGATGHVGSAVADFLLHAGADVRVVVRNEAKAAHVAERGAEVAVADLADDVGLAAAIHGSSGLFIVLPLDVTTDDFDSQTRELVDSIVAAINEKEIAHVVVLSSQGAHRGDHNGPIRALYHLENALREKTFAIVTAVRPGHFQEKVRDFVGVARAEKFYPVLADTADRPISMTATCDIGQVAAQAMLSPPSASEVIDVLGPEYTEREVAEALGRKLGHDLAVTLIPTEQRSGLFQQLDMNAHISDLLAELYLADEQGLLVSPGDRAVQVTTELDSTLDHVLEQE